MRIGCLQFETVRGDVDENLSRAEEIMADANPDDLDILILPEMAFSGYCFRSVDEIRPLLEPVETGITTLWARSQALQHDCTVVAGYPEKVEAGKGHGDDWGKAPGNYNSVLIVNSDGEITGNYSKKHLFVTDEVWASKSDKGFFKGPIQPLNRAVVGISMDMNPDKFQTPWQSFEFAFHILKARANLVIVNMAWPTDDDMNTFNKMLEEPDMDTLMYWLSRLEPVIDREGGDEVIVVFANRVGAEDDYVYAGSSAVLGIHQGEVNVYGMLGRGDNDLLVVDTEKEPYGKLVYSAESGLPAAGSMTPRPERQIAAQFESYQRPPTSQPARQSSAATTKRDRADSRASDPKGLLSSTPKAMASSGRPNSSGQSGSLPKRESESSSRSSRPGKTFQAGLEYVNAISDERADENAESGPPMHFTSRRVASRTQEFVSNQAARVVDKSNPSTPRLRALSTSGSLAQNSPALAPQPIKLYGGEVAFLYNGLPHVPEHDGGGSRPSRLKDHRLTYNPSLYGDDAPLSPASTRASVIVSMYRKGVSHSGSNALPRGEANPAAGRRDRRVSRPAPKKPAPLQKFSPAGASRSSNLWDDRPLSPTETIITVGTIDTIATMKTAELPWMNPMPLMPSTPANNPDEMMAVQQRLREISLRAQAADEGLWENQQYDVDADDLLAVRALGDNAKKKQKEQQQKQQQQAVSGNDSRRGRQDMAATHHNAPAISSQLSSGRLGGEGSRGQQQRAGRPHDDAYHEPAGVGSKPQQPSRGHGGRGAESPPVEPSRYRPAEESRYQTTTFAARDRSPSSSSDSDAGRRPRISRPESRRGRPHASFGQMRGGGGGGTGRQREPPPTPFEEDMAPAAGDGTFFVLKRPTTTRQGSMNNIHHGGGGGGQAMEPTPLQRSRSTTDSYRLGRGGSSSARNSPTPRRAESTRRRDASGTGTGTPKRQASNQNLRGGDAGAKTGTGTGSETKAGKVRKALPWVETWMPPAETMTNLHWRSVNNSSTVTSSSMASLSTRPTLSPIDPTPVTPRAMWAYGDPELAGPLVLDSGGDSRVDQEYEQEGGGDRKFWTARPGY